MNRLLPAYRGATVEIPREHRKWSFFGRIVRAGLCSYTELRSGEVGIEDVFAMHHILDVDDYANAVLMQRESRNVHR